MSPMPTPIHEKFWPKVLVLGPFECWPWTACCLLSGYGKLGDQLAHRVSFEITYGPVPAGLFVLHACDHP